MAESGAPELRPWMRAKGRNLRLLVMQFQAVMDVLVEGIMVRDQDGRLSAYNAAAEKLLGGSLQPCLGKDALAGIRLVDAEGHALDGRALPSCVCLRTGEAQVGFILGVPGPDRIRWLETNSLAIRSSRQRSPVGVVTSFWDISEKKTRFDTLLVEATHDPLTALPNRRAFEIKLNRLLRSAGRRHRLMSLCLCDLDHFKGVNDRLGHLSGDAVLCQFARLLKISLRGDDFPARLGGDEFAVLFDGISAAEAGVVLERIRTGFAFRSEAQTTAVSASFGVVDWSPGMSPLALVAAADTALYLAKAEGRNRVQVGVRGPRSGDSFSSSA